LRLRLRKYVKKETGLNVDVKESIGTFQQTYSHFKLTLYAYHCESRDAKQKGRWVPFSKLRLFPMSRIHRRIAQTINAQTRG
jgi:A/G-specific adenine glycosylase